MTTLAPDLRRDPRATQPGWAPLFVVLAGTFVTFLDFFIVNVALPAIRADLHAGTSAVSLVVAGYGLTFAAGMITGGRLGDLYGRRRMFAIGLALFTLTSLMCGLAPNAELLVAARMLQGASGALLTPQVLAILGSTYDGPRRAKAFAAFGFAMGIAGVLGQLIGGALIQADVFGLDWRTIFLINIPVGLVALPLVGRVVPESRGPRARLDIVGALLGTAVIAALVLPLVEGREHHWPAWTWFSLAAVPLLGTLFLISQRRRHSPLMELSLFRIRSFAVGSAAGMTFGLVPPSFFFVLALYLQLGRGYDPLFSGTVFAVVGIGYFAAMFAAEALVRRLGRQVLALGAALVAVGCGALVLTAHASSAWDLAPGLALVGFGIGAVLVPLSSMALAGLDPAHAGSAAGVLATAQQIGAAIGVAVVGTVFFALAPITHAFVISLVVVAGLTLATATLAQLLPRD